jgi:transposase-like protein
MSPVRRKVVEEERALQATGVRVGYRHGGSRRGAGRKRVLTVEERAVALHDGGLSFREIAKRLGVHHTTVLRWVSKGVVRDERTTSETARTKGSKVVRGASPKNEGSTVEESPKMTIPEINTSDGGHSNIKNPSLINSPLRSEPSDDAPQKFNPRTAKHEDLIVAFETLRARDDVLIAEVAQSRAEREAVPDEVAGRPSLSGFREKMWRRWCASVLEIPAVIHKFGRREAFLRTSATVLADLQLLKLGRPWTAAKARRFNSLTHCFTDYGLWLGIFGGDNADGIRIGQSIIIHAAADVFGESVVNIFEKSQDLSAPPMGPQWSSP